MTPKEKAIELVDKFENIVPTIDGYYSYQEMIEEHFNKSKQCALIVVDEILKITWVDKFLIVEDYWKEVKQEIEKL
jgi:hypothetical protein